MGASDSVETLVAVWEHLLATIDAPGRSQLMLSRPVRLVDGILLIAVPNDFVRDRVANGLRERVEQIVSDFVGTSVSITTTVDSGIDQLPRPSAQSGDEDEETVPLPGDADNLKEITKLNPRYVFDTFVIGESNRFAHAAALAVAERPGTSYNPLVIYAPSGLGKTHLLHAIGHYIIDYHPNLRVKYVSTEEMTNDFINSISDNQMIHFRQMYREVDVLLLDDIQFMEGKIQTQEEFFHTFNALHNAQKQIVMTSDRPPKALEALEPRLRSRFEWGLQADIQPADLETRIAILRKKAADDNMEIDPEVLDFIGSNIHSNIRELEGALIRVTAFASLYNQHLDAALAEIVLKDLMPEGMDQPVTAAIIISETAQYFQLTVENITGSSRTATLALARQIAMYLCRDMTDLSLPRIGVVFGRDHTTVLHACQKITRLMATDKRILTSVNELTVRIKKTRL